MELLLMLICLVLYVTVLKDSNTYIEDTTSIEISNKERNIDNDVVVSALQKSVIWVLNSDLEDKRERLVELLRTMICYTDTSEFLEKNPNVFKYIFENT